MQTNRIVTLVVGMAVVVGLAQADPAGSKTAAAPGAKKTIVLVHGAWVAGSSWSKVIPLLEAKGYPVIAVHLPMTSTADDVAATKRAIEQAPGDVVLVGHSYGGNVISIAGNDDKVKSLVYVDAFGLDDGESINGLSKDHPPAWVKTIKIDSGGFGWLTADEGAKDFAQDIPAAEQKLVSATQAPFPMKAFDDAMKNPAWKNKPSWYVRGTADRIIEPAAQEQMAKRMKAKLTSVNASHLSPMSKPREVSIVIVDAANAPNTTASR
jgi:pimeloyl-ACP methyl ester carboxylesterase